MDLKPDARDVRQQLERISASRVFARSDRMIRFLRFIVEEALRETQPNLLTFDRDGNVVSHVAEDQRAWHAGQSKMKDGRSGVNDFSIGIELVNLNDGVDPFPDVQIQAMRSLVKAIISRHPIRHIVTHYECADPPGRKSDPAGFHEGWIDGLLE